MGFKPCLYLTFIDFEDAFDYVDRHYIRESLIINGVPAKIIALVKTFYLNIEGESSMQQLIL